MYNHCLVLVVPVELIAILDGFYRVNKCYLHIGMVYGDFNKGNKTIRAFIMVN